MKTTKLVVCGSLFFILGFAVLLLIAWKLPDTYARVTSFLTGWVLFDGARKFAKWVRPSTEDKP